MEENKEILQAIEKKFAELKEKSANDNDGKFEAVEKDLTEIKESISKAANKEEIEKLTKAFNTLSGEVQSISEKGKAKENPVNKFKESLTERAKALRDNADTLKTVGTMSFTNSVTGQIPVADRDPGVNDLNKRMFTIRNRSSVGSTSSNLVEWTYKTAKEGSAGMTAEGAAKSQVDWTYVVDSASVKKVTAYVKITKEMLDDIDGIMSDINGELSYELDYKEEAQLIAGTGLTVYLNGITKYAQSLDSTGLAGTIAIPNKWDVIGAAIKQIGIETEGRSQADTIFMNPADVFAMVHGSRTTTDEYNAPLAVVTPDGTRIYGLPVVETNSITAGSFLVADMRKFYIKDRETATIAMGYENDDWTKNLVTILAEKRLVSYVKKNDEEAFVYDTFADGVTFLTAAS